MNPHLDMANQVFDRMFGLPKPRLLEEIPPIRMDYQTIAEVEADLKGVHCDERR